MPNVNQLKTTLVLYCVLLAGCATTSGQRDPRDPWEGYNRAAYEFNDVLDKALFKPIAQGYRKVLPQPVRNGVTNFFSNLGDIAVVANDLLQAKFRQAGSDFTRLFVNSTAGILGVIDVGSKTGLPKHNEDFGQTLGYWGIKQGPYLVLIFFGPSTVRDAFGRIADTSFSVYPYIDSLAVRNSVYLLDLINFRANLLDSEKIFDEAALDRYTFLRDAYLQRRERLVYDGKPPQTAPDYDLDELDELDKGGELEQPGSSALPVPSDPNDSEKDTDQE